MRAPIGRTVLAAGANWTRPLEHPGGSVNATPALVAICANSTKTNANTATTSATTVKENASTTTDTTTASVKLDTPDATANLKKIILFQITTGFIMVITYDS